MNIEQFKEFLESEKGRNSIISYVSNLIVKATIEEYQIDKLYQKKCFVSFLEKVLNKYESASYINRYEKRNKYSKESLLWFLYHYALKYGRKCNEEETLKFSGKFTKDLVYCDGYVFHIISGQGSFIKIFKI